MNGGGMPEGAYAIVLDSWVRGYEGVGAGVVGVLGLGGGFLVGLLEALAESADFGFGVVGAGGYLFWL